MFTDKRIIDPEHLETYRQWQQKMVPECFQDANDTISKPFQEDTCTTQHGRQTTKKTSVTIAEEIGHGH
ncbi:unnamed protein product [Toxocara canis]|uniref:PFL domain-containing protein n=1 Tax=Toxocara canis TaxID=6265 RepID=A0A183U755_TOXCA|nr:unnamed protein product [Toxocara canis]